MKRLILGGEASGKSDHADGLLSAAAGRRCVVAVARAGDFSFRKRILKHRIRRPRDIRVFEAGHDLTGTLRNAAESFDCILLESLDFWVFELMHEGRDVDAAADGLLHLLGTRLSSQIFLVSSEVGMGPTSGDAFTRAFVRHLGTLNQRVAALCDTVDFVIAGRVLPLPAGAES
jgi:adenosylcobinamide kinase/adenosylcobinamide-phosphate guanylyltransferase